MSKTPVCDFLKKCRDNNLRFHMPGHKGVGGIEKYDITEIDGADVLYSPKGIILESEKIASGVFESQATFYSTEGSSLCIRGLVYLISSYAKSLGKNCKIVAVRNVHSSFISACALTNVNPVWFYGEGDTIISKKIDYAKLKSFLRREKPVALYLTSPDYLGYRSDIEQISKICHEENVLLAVDNAHGSYLKFLENSNHPLDLGADLCVESAHKTLPSLTGTAYLHVGKSAPSFFKENANFALSLFASTSPSYILLASLDAFNGKAEAFKEEVVKTSLEVSIAKKRLESCGYVLYGDEPLKITIECKKYGYYGNQLADILKSDGIYVEFYDKDYITFMISPSNGAESLKFLVDCLAKIPQKSSINLLPPQPVRGKAKLSICEAVFSNYEEISVDDSNGKVLAGLTVSCPPAVPILVSGEVITKEVINAFKYYGIKTVKVVK